MHFFFQLFHLFENILIILGEEKKTLSVRFEFLDNELCDVKAIRLIL